MSTLNDVISAHLGKLEADVSAIKAKAASDVAAVEAEMAAAKVHLTGLMPWMSHELSVAKDALLGFFAKLEGTAASMPAAPAPAPAPAADPATPAA